jgi:hypothetical protein
VLDDRRGFEPCRSCKPNAVSHELVGGALVAMLHAAHKGVSPWDQPPRHRDRGGRAFRALVGKQGCLERVNCLRVSHLFRDREGLAEALLFRGIELVDVCLDALAVRRVQQATSSCPWSLSE